MMAPRNAKADKNAYTVCGHCEKWVYNWRLSMQHSRCQCGKVLYVYSGPSYSSGRGDEGGGERWWGAAADSQNARGKDSPSAVSYLEAACKAVTDDPKHAHLAKLLQEAVKVEQVVVSTPIQELGEDELSKEYKSTLHEAKEASAKAAKAFRLWSEAEGLAAQRKKSAEESAEAEARAKLKAEECLEALHARQRARKGPTSSEVKAEEAGEGGEFSYDFNFQAGLEEDVVPEFPEDMQEQLQAKLEMVRVAKKQFEAKCKEARDRLAEDKKKHAAEKDTMEAEFSKLNDQIAETLAAAAEGAAKKKLRTADGGGIPTRADTKADLDKKQAEQKAKEAADNKKAQESKREEDLIGRSAAIAAERKAEADKQREEKDKEQRGPAAEEAAAVEQLGARSVEAVGPGAPGSPATGGGRKSKQGK